ncbi:hypothetical protein [Haloplanus sp. C73]|uniref:hypothetical protein n=1 Tax=Haloplanus sp. C73 TaxID=3421641 RepID=UPI003EBB6A3D
MADVRTLLAVVLGALLGLVCILAPGAVVRTQTAGRRPNGSGGEYGSDSVATRWRRLVQALGVACLLVAAYLGSTML